MNFAKPGWVYWGNCVKCGRKFDTRRRTRTECPQCNTLISPRITRRDSLEFELRNWLALFDDVQCEVIAPRARRINLYSLLNCVMRVCTNWESVLSEYSYYYPYC